MKKTISIILLLILPGMISSCAPGPNQFEAPPESIAGFWRGLWHGFIVLFTFIISLFSDNYNIYEVNNNGNWYNFGYLLGIMCFFGGSSGGAAKRSCCK